MVFEKQGGRARGVIGAWYAVPLRFLWFCMGVIVLGHVSAALAASQQEVIARLEDPERATWQKPDEVVAALALKGGETVADIGAGTGYFTVLLAKAVGGKGKVEALDINRELLDHLHARLQTEQITNVVTREVPPDNPLLAGRSIDLIFLCNVYAYLPERAPYLGKLAAALKRGGRIAVIDFGADTGGVPGLPVDRRVAKQTTLEEFDAAGFTLLHEHEFLPHQYFLVFEQTRAYTVDALAADVEAVLQTKGEEEQPVQTMQRIAPLLRRFLQEGRLDAKYQQPAGGMDITTYMLFIAPEGAFSIAALVLRPGARTPVHDHQTWTVWGTYKGKDRETPFARSDGEDGDFPQLEPSSVRVLPDAGLSFTPPPPHDVHMVENVGDTVSVSIHIHGADMSTQTRHRYDTRQQLIIPFVQSYEPGS